jgi:formylglycine-generating enzyme required for sulfatase activity
VTLTIVELVAAFFFVASSGLFFNERFRSNRWLVLCAGIIALLSTYFLTEELIDRSISQRLEGMAEAPIADNALEGSGELQSSPSASALEELPSRAPPLSSAALPEMVRIPGHNFEVGRYEVTFAQWDACAAEGGCNRYRPSDEGWGRGNRPVINVSWNDAQAYVQWLSQRTGQRFRLLTEAEWEIAARAGTTTDFSWGNQEPVCDQNALNGANFPRCTDNRTLPVGSFQPNGYGIHDVHGNVSEWVEDCFGTDCSRERVLKGISWVPSVLDVRTASYFRGGSGPEYRYNNIGFRVARTL